MRGRLQSTVVHSLRVFLLSDQEGELVCGHTFLLDGLMREFRLQWAPLCPLEDGLYEHLPLHGIRGTHSERTEVGAREEDGSAQPLLGTAFRDSWEKERVPLALSFLLHVMPLGSRLPSSLLLCPQEAARCALKSGLPENYCPPKKCTQ